LSYGGDPELANGKGWTAGGQPNLDEEVARFIGAVCDAGGWDAYLRAPREALVRLRSLCALGRATPPADLDRLFSTRRASALPDAVFWLVLQFWCTARDIQYASKSQSDVNPATREVNEQLHGQA